MSAFDLFIQQLINGLVKGSLYAMIALGYTMVYGIAKMLNFAHGAFLSLSALVGWQVAQAMGAAGWGSFIVSILVGAGVGAGGGGTGGGV